MDGKQDYDVLGFIYEYLISMFAANAGKKAGEFYTPHEVSLLMSEIVAEHLKDRKEIKIYDITVTDMIQSILQYSLIFKPFYLARLIRSYFFRSFSNKVDFAMVQNLTKFICFNELVYVSAILYD